MGFPKSKMGAGVPRKGSLNLPQMPHVRDLLTCEGVAESGRIGQPRDVARGVSIVADPGRSATMVGPHRDMGVFPTIIIIIIRGRGHTEIWVWSLPQLQDVVQQADWGQAPAVRPHRDGTHRDMGRFPPALCP